MRSNHQIERYVARLEGVEDDLARFRLACYVACIPKDFWGTKSDRVNHNRALFDSLIVPYCRKHRRARRHGYGLLLLGDNGAGKTMFLSYVLTQAIYRGYSVYYTTMSQLAIDLGKSFNDPEFARDLEEHLQCDFLAIDEMGKEHDKSEFLMKRLEHTLKRRYDDHDPTLMASNLDYGSFCAQYHSTVKSMVDGKYQKAILEPGDFRRTTAAKMRKHMGYRT